MPAKEPGTTQELPDLSQDMEFSFVFNYFTFLL